MVSICHSVARERDPLACFSTFRLYLHFSSRFRKAPSLQHAYTLTWNLSLNSVVARTLAGYYENSEAPSNLHGIRSTYPGGRAKNPTTAAVIVIPFLSARVPRVRATLIGIREISSISNGESDKKLNAER